MLPVEIEVHLPARQRWLKVKHPFETSQVDLLVTSESVVKGDVDAVLVEHIEELRLGGHQGYIGKAGGVLLQDLPTLYYPYPQVADAFPPIDNVLFLRKSHEIHHHVGLGNPYKIGKVLLHPLYPVQLSVGKTFVDIREGPSCRVEDYLGLKTDPAECLLYQEVKHSFLIRGRKKALVGGAYRQWTFQNLCGASFDDRKRE